MIASSAAETDVSYDRPVILQPGTGQKCTDSPSDNFSSLNFNEITEKTNHELEEEKRISFALIPTSAYLHTIPSDKPSLKQEVDAVVTRIGEVSVVCEVLLDAGSFEIQLPKALLPVSPYYGLPLSISLDESSGYTVPVVRKRIVPEKMNKEDQEKLTALIDSL